MDSPQQVGVSVLSGSDTTRSTEGSTIRVLDADLFQVGSFWCWGLVVTDMAATADALWVVGKNGRFARFELIVRVSANFTKSPLIGNTYIRNYYYFFFFASLVLENKVSL